MPTSGGEGTHLPQEGEPCDLYLDQTTPQQCWVAERRDAFSNNGLHLVHNRKQSAENQNPSPHSF